MTRASVAVLHLVTDDRVLAGPDVLARAEAALEAGRDRVWLHLRGPGTGGRALWERGRELLPLVRASGSGLIVNDRVDVARVLGADGAHLPEAGLPVAAARRLLGGGARVGRSVHGPTPPGEGPERPDYLFAGTVFRTPSHPGRPGAGPARVAEVADAARGIPVIGIGGITPERVAEVVAAGAAGIAVLRGVWASPDPGGAVERFLRALDEVRR